MSLALQYFKALSDETRLRLMHVLNRHELSVNELVTILEMGQSRVSRHLKILTSAGLLTSRRDGLWVFYSASSDGEGREFLDAIGPFITVDMVLQADLDMAQKMIEERALKTRQFFNAIAEDWDELNREVLGGFDLAEAVATAMSQSMASSMTSSMIPFASPSGSPSGSTPMQPCNVAVDLGCGTGSVLERMLEHSREVIGVDGSPRMLELARRRFVEGAERVSLRIGELDHLPLRDAEADFACINMVLHHLSDPQVALTEIRRVLRSGGLLLVADFDQHGNERMRTDYGDRWLGFDLDHLTQMLTNAGFTLQTARKQSVEKSLALHVVLAVAL